MFLVYVGVMFIIAIVCVHMEGWDQDLWIAIMTPRALCLVIMFSVSPNPSGMLCGEAGDESWGIATEVCLSEMP